MDGSLGYHARTVRSTAALGALLDRVRAAARPLAEREYATRLGSLACLRHDLATLGEPLDAPDRAPLLAAHANLIGGPGQGDLDFRLVVFPGGGARFLLLPCLASLRNVWEERSGATPWPGPGQGAAAREWRRLLAGRAPEEAGLMMRLHVPPLTLPDGAVLAGRLPDIRERAARAASALLLRGREGGAVGDQAIASLAFDLLPRLDRDVTVDALCRRPRRAP